MEALFCHCALRVKSGRQKSLQNKNHSICCSLHFSSPSLFFQPHWQRFDSRILQSFHFLFSQNFQILKWGFGSEGTFLFHHNNNWCWKVQFPLHSSMASTCLIHENKTRRIIGPTTRIQKKIRKEKKKEKKKKHLDFSVFQKLFPLMWWSYLIHQIQSLPVLSLLGQEGSQPKRRTYAWPNGEQTFRRGEEIRLWWEHPL